MTDIPKRRREYFGALMQHPVGHGIAVANAEFLSVSHQGELGITSSERARYYGKVANLALCYSGFAVNHRIKEYIGAGRSAFLCCAYDIVTDWRDFGDPFRTKLENLLGRYSNPSMEALALDLYDKDRDGSLGDNGLERGAIALRLIAEIMGIREKLEERGIDIDAAGKVLQIVDDVLDFAHDQKTGDTNCLLSPQRDTYLHELITTQVEDHFEKGSVLCLMIEKAKTMAETLLRGE